MCVPFMQIRAKGPTFLWKNRMRSASSSLVGWEASPGQLLCLAGVAVEEYRNRNEEGKRVGMKRDARGDMAAQHAILYSLHCLMSY